MRITTHLLTHNNAELLDATLKSLLPLGGEIIVVDLNSEDDTIDICKKYDVIIVKSNYQDRSKIRNEVVSNSKNGWQLYLEPGEVLASGQNKILELNNPAIYWAQVFQNNGVITKEVRLWHKSLQLRFKFPIYETLEANGEQELKDFVIYNRYSSATTNNFDVILEWKKNHPLLKEPYYYEAFSLLQQKRYQEFIVAATEYLHRDQVGISAVMMQYYMSIVQLYLGDIKNASRGTVACIGAKILMAEFWCLLGDIYYKIKKYKKALLYYENALILGKKRLKNDLWPIEISKYKKYPLKMIDSCNHILSNTKVFKKM